MRSATFLKGGSLLVGSSASTGTGALRIVLAFSLLLLSVACSPEPEPPELVCSDGAVRDCYDGPEGTFGVGECKAGEQTCQDGEWGACKGQVLPVDEICDGKDNNCDGRTDEELLNACGGCEPLEAIPGESCRGCGTWECIDFDTVDCTVADTEGEGDSSCLADNGCLGVKVCHENGDEACVAVEERNVCGLCGGPDLADLGENCTNADGCSGTWECSEEKDSLQCQAPAKNNCGICGAEDVALVGSSCDPGNGCEGKYVCDGDGSAAVCNPLAKKNECGVCGGPPLLGLGGDCQVGSCHASYVCNDDGTALECDTSGPNNCGACDLPEIPDLDGACHDDDACPGTKVCNSSGDASYCSVPFGINECGECAPAPDKLGDSCHDRFNCPGVYVCADENTPEGEDSFCLVDQPEGVGNNCIDDQGCTGFYACDSEGGLVCQQSEDPEACAIHGHLLISQISLGREGGSNPNNQFIELYNPGDEPVDLRTYELWLTDFNTPATTDLACIECPECNPEDKVCPSNNPDCAPEEESCPKLSCTDNNTRFTTDWYGEGACAQKAKIKPRSYFLLGRRSGYSPAEGEKAADGHINLTLPTKNGHGQAWLYNGRRSDNPEEPVDMVGWGTASPHFEGSGPAPVHDRTAPGPGPNKPPIGSIIRKAFLNSTSESMGALGSDSGWGNRVDQNDNASDFVELPARRPRNSESPAEPPISGGTP